MAQVIEPTNDAGYMVANHIELVLASPGASWKWFTEFGHLNRGDMLTSEQHRCHNEKEISAQSLNANPLNWSLTRTTPWQMQPALWMSAFPQ